MREEHCKRKQSLHVCQFDVISTLCLCLTRAGGVRIDADESQVWRNSLRLGERREGVGVTGFPALWI